MKNMVDERFELIALIFRLAGIRPEYCEIDTDYQRETATFFTNFSQHPAVKLAKSFNNKNEIWLGNDAILKFAAHIEKKNDKFLFIEDISSLFDKGKWNEAVAKDFLSLLNVFYVDTKYGDFFNSHIPYFEEITQKFINTRYSTIDFEWFKKYFDLSDLRCVYTPSKSRQSICVKRSDKVIYCVCAYYANFTAIIHEFCHVIGNPLAQEWYKENLEFRKLCDNSVNAEKLTSYSTGWVMACEYVTRAYTVLYCCESTGGIVKNGTFYKWNEYAPIVITDDIKKGFIYIGEVYQMVIEYENKKKNNSGSLI